MYSTYDKTRNVYRNLRTYQLCLRTGLSSIMLVVIYYIGQPRVSGFKYYLWFGIGFIALFLVYDKLLTLVWSKYSEKREKEKDAKKAMNNLCNRMAKIINAVPKRNKGEQFKKAYELSGKSISEFEHILGIAMKHEVKEVWVTAFCRKGIVVRATATIGSVYRCRPSDDVRNWPQHIYKLNCDEIRQYHNHPVCNNYAFPSAYDLKSNILLRSILGINSYMMKTFIVFWNQIYEYRVIEYFDNRETKLHYAFDVAD